MLARDIPHGGTPQCTGRAAWVQPRHGAWDAPRFNKSRWRFRQNFGREGKSDYTNWSMKVVGGFGRFRQRRQIRLCDAASRIPTQTFRLIPDSKQAECVERAPIYSLPENSKFAWIVQQSNLLALRIAVESWKKRLPIGLPFQKIL